MKILLILCLVYPVFGYSITPKKHKDICEKIAGDIKKANAYMNKIYASMSNVLSNVRSTRKYIVKWDRADTSGYSFHLSYMRNIYEDRSKVYADESKTVADTIKYKCFYKHTPACNESLKDMSKALADLSILNADLSNIYADRSKAFSPVRKADADASKALADASEALGELSIAEYRLSKANADRSKVDAMSKLHMDYRKAEADWIKSSAHVKKYCKKKTPTDKPTHNN